jgi:hypothetical protein
MSLPTTVDLATTETESAQAPACALCGARPAQGEPLSLQTGELLGSQVKLADNKVVSSYGKFKTHTYLVCDACRRKRQRQGVWLVVGYVAFFIFMCAAVPGVTWLVSGIAGLAANWKNLMLVSPVVTFMLVIFSGIGFWINGPESKLKVVAIKDRMRAEGVQVNKYRAFTDKEYKQLKL